MLLLLLVPPLLLLPPLLAMMVVMVVVVVVVMVMLFSSAKKPEACNSWCCQALFAQRSAWCACICSCMQLTCARMTQACARESGCARQTCMVCTPLQFLVIWRFFRTAALADGVVPPENMGRCVCNNYDIEVRACVNNDIGGCAQAGPICGLACLHAVVGVRARTSVCVCVCAHVRVRVQLAPVCVDGTFDKCNLKSLGLLPCSLVQCCERAQPASVCKQNFGAPPQDS